MRRLFIAVSSGCYSVRSLPTASLRLNHFNNIDVSENGIGKFTCSRGKGVSALLQFSNGLVAAVIVGRNQLLNALKVFNLYRNGFPMITHREISLKSGKQIIALDQQIFDAGTHEFQIEVIVADEVSENNTAYALTQISGQSRLLCIASNPFVAKTIKTVLESENFVVDVIRPSEFPTDFLNDQ